MTMTVNNLSFIYRVFWIKIPEISCVEVSSSGNSSERTDNPLKSVGNSDSGIKIPESTCDEVSSGHLNTDNPLKSIRISDIPYNR